MKNNFVSVGKILNFHGVQGEAKLGYSKNREEFLVGQIIDKKTTLAARKKIYSYLIEKESNLEMIEFIQKLLEERKEEIKVKQK